MSRSFVKFLFPGLLLLALLLSAPASLAQASSAPPQTASPPLPGMVHPVPPGTAETKTVTYSRSSLQGAEHVQARRTALTGAKASAGVAPYDGGLFNCTVGAGEGWGGGPEMSYGGSLSCTEGTPVRVVMALYSAHVNAPTNFATVATQPWECGNSNPCKTTNYPYNAAATQILQACNLSVVKGTDGTDYNFDPFCVQYYYNNNGAGYPGTPSYAPFSIPFPGPSYTVCDDNPNLTPPCPRSSTFRSDVEARYTANGWTFPSGTYQAHHIKPLAFGGGNADTNGVLLLVTDHAQYTSWFNNFTPS